MNEVGFNQEFAKLELQYELLKERVASQLEIYTHLVEVVGPNLKANYMMLIGQFEHRIFELKTEINRWKRRFTLVQQAKNHGETPNYVLIETKLDDEFAAYLEEIKKHLSELKEASLLFHAEKMSEKESNEIRAAYLNAVKKLHPDINLNLPVAATELWNQIQKAHSDEDWSQLRFLIGMVDNVVAGKTTFASSADGMAALKASCEKLHERSREMAERTKALKSNAPFVYEELLNDDAKVHERQCQLKAQINALEECAKEYEELWNHAK